MTDCRDCDWVEQRKFILEILSDIRSFMPEVRKDVKELGDKIDAVAVSVIDKEVVSAMIAASFEARDKKRQSGQITMAEVQKVSQESAMAVIASRKSNGNGQAAKNDNKWEPWKYVLLGAAVAIPNILIEVVKLLRA